MTRRWAVCSARCHVRCLLICSTFAKVVGPKAAPTVVTLAFITFWYALNIAFNLQARASGSVDA